MSYSHVYARLGKDNKYKIEAFDTLSLKEKSFLHYFMKTGKRQEAAIRAGFTTSKAGTIAGKILKKPAAKKFMDRAMAAAERKVQWDFEDKLRKLKIVADLAIPDTATSMEDIAHQAGISAIAESNKMQGHYSAEKVINTNVNVDVDLLQVKELIDQYKREY